MKKLLLTAVLAVASVIGSAQAQVVIAQYNMGGSLGTPTELNGFTGAGNFTSTRGTLATSTVTSYTGANGTNSAVTTTNWTAAGGEWRVSLDLTGYQDVTFSGWSQMASNTGPRDFQLRVSYDGGSTFSNIGSQYSIANGNSPQSGFTLGSLANNNANVIVSWFNASGISVNGGATAATGTSRFSNFDITATAIPEPSTYALIGLGLGGLFLLRRTRNASKV